MRILSVSQSIIRTILRHGVIVFTIVAITTEQHGAYTATLVVYTCNQRLYRLENGSQRDDTEQGSNQVSESMKKI